MSEEKYSQLKRIEHSLNNYRLSIQNNLKKLGCDEQEERFHFLYQKVSQANLSKRIKLEEDQKDKFRRLFENMWINEAFVQESGISFGTLYKSNLEQLKNIDERFNILKLIIGG